MCNMHSHGQAHGVRSDQEKTVADLRDDLVEELKAITKYEAQIPVVANGDFEQMDAVVHSLEHIRDEHKKLAADLIQMIAKLDPEQGRALAGISPSHDHPAESTHTH